MDLSGERRRVVCVHLLTGAGAQRTRVQVPQGDPSGVAAQRGILGIDGQQVSRDHLVTDGDVLELHAS